MYSKNNKTLLRLLDNQKDEVNNFEEAYLVHKYTDKSSVTNEVLVFQLI